MKVVHLDSAEALLDALSERGPLWAPDRSQWIFRGHANSDWRLQPPLRRRPPTVPEKPTFTRPDQPGYSIKRAVFERLYGAVHDTGYAQELVDGLREWEMVKAFISNARRAGLWVPEDFVSYAEHVFPSDPTRDFGWGPWGHVKDWPQPPVWDALALAQHHGLPTCILSWDRSPLVAAYFAAREVAEAAYYGQTEADSRICVWALCAHAVADLATANVQGNSAGPQPHVVIASEATDRLRVGPWGTFTVARRVPDAHPDFHELDRLLASLKALDDDRVWLCKLTLPVAQAPRLLALLSVAAVTATSVFPTYDGAAQTELERGFCVP